MAFRTVGADIVFSELLFMIICMAIAAILVLEWIGITALMTIFAFYGLMLVDQLKIGTRMVKPIKRFNGFERLYSMTIRASLTKLVLVRIGMAIGARFILQAFEFLKVLSIADFNLMAFFAGNLCMASLQLIGGFIMVEQTGWFKGRAGVAIVAISSQSL